MTTTVITTNTTAGLTMAVNDLLIVSPTGTIIAPLATVTGNQAINQSVTIAGYVDLLYFWLGGHNTFNIAAGGVFSGHSADTSIFLGADSGVSVFTGNNHLTNDGTIFADNNAIKLFGGSNVINNVGNISAGATAITVGLEGNGNLVNNTGTISAGTGIAVSMQGGVDALINSGDISSLSDAAVSMAGFGQSLENSGTISTQVLAAVFAYSSDNCLISNSGVITAGITGIGISNANVNNSGEVYGGLGAIRAEGGSSVVIVNTGTLSSESAVIILFTIGTNTVTNSGTISGPGTAIVSSNAIDIITNTGKIFGNILLGDGNDIFDGRGGTVVGTVDGGSGNDTYYVDNASLVLIEQATVGEIDSVFSEVNYRLGANLENLTLLNAGNLNGSGTLLANVITGNAGDNRLVGLDGNDTLIGDLGNDRLYGGLGNDSVVGGDGDDTLVGQAGNDQLQGGDGDDVLNGGLGKDVMVGGTGQDVFVFATVAQSGNTAATADVIVDFTKGDDLINLAAIDANRGNATANDAFTFIGSAVFTGVAGQLHYVQTAGNTFVEMDVNGDGIADSVIQLNGLILLNAGDFIL